jgi:hypothetical protein
MLEKGSILPDALIWRPGMTQWLPLALVEPFKDVVLFQNKMWYYIDHNSVQNGPVSSIILTQKMREGSIDGLTLVYSDDTSGWKKISDIHSLRIIMMKIAAEDDENSDDINTLTGPVDTSCIQVFPTDEEVIPAIPEEMKKKPVTDKKRFAADNGKR